MFRKRVTPHIGDATANATPLWLTLEEVELQTRSVVDGGNLFLLRCLRRLLRRLKSCALNAGSAGLP